MSYQGNTSCRFIIITFIPLRLPPFPYFSYTVPSFNFVTFTIFLLLCPFHQSSFLCFILFITFHSAQQNVIPGVNVRGGHAKGQRVCLLGGRSHPWQTAVLMEPRFQTHFLTLLLSVPLYLMAIWRLTTLVEIVLKEHWDYKCVLLKQKCI